MNSITLTPVPEREPRRAGEIPRTSQGERSVSIMTKKAAGYRESRGSTDTGTILTDPGGW